MDSPKPAAFFVSRFADCTVYHCLWLPQLYLSDITIGIDSIEFFKTQGDDCAFREKDT